MLRLHSRTGFLAVIALLLLAGPMTPTSAQEATSTAGGLTILGSDESFAGVTRGEWSARWAQWAFSLPPEANPNFDPTGEQCGYGQSGPVFFLPAAFVPEPYDRTCVVPAGTALYIAVGGASCTTVEPPPYFGRNEEELRACAAAQAYTVPHQITIDGQDVPNLEAYRTNSPLFTMTFEEDNFLGVPPGVALSVAEGASLLIAPPPPGEYEITVTADFTDVGGEVLPGTTRVIVEVPQVSEPAASPEAATPVASPVATVPCSVEPRSVAEVGDIWASLAASPVATHGGHAGSSMADLPQGEPVDPATIAVIESVVQQSWACSRTDTLRAFALYTDDFLRVIAPPEAERDMALSGLEVTPAPDELTPAATVSGASEARMLPDGRVGALVTVTQPDGFPTVIFYVLEQQPDGRWLIDEEIFVQ